MKADFSHASDEELTKKHWELTKLADDLKKINCPIAAQTTRECAALFLTEMERRSKDSK